jgi:radical SAM protein with 4Fe4S-binding SPASM domain
MFDRNNSTLGIMDDLQIAVHTYDGCARGCSGCVVDKHFKNQGRFKNILTEEQMKTIHSRVQEYYQWIQENLNTKKEGYFGINGFKVNHFSYTFRFGNHSELPIEELLKISSIMNSKFKVFSTAPTDDISKFYELTKPENNSSESRFFLEIIYDPIADKAENIRNMILEMRKHNILGYPEILITKRLLSLYSNPKKFIDECVIPLGNIETQMQFGRYSPSKTRNFNTTQVVPLDIEVEWLKGIAYWVTYYNLNIHPIPIGEYAVTFLDEYKEINVQKENGEIDEEKLAQIPEEPFNIKAIKDKTRDIFLTSLYIDHNLDLFVWSESMGQHVLDSNFGFPKLGNIKEKSISEIVTDQYGVLEKMLNETVKHLMLHKKCASCRYKSFCASHAIPFFRKFQEDDGKHCYGYIPVIREFQKKPDFLQNMINGFKKLEF